MIRSKYPGGILGQQELSLSLPDAHVVPALDDGDHGNPRPFDEGLGDATAFAMSQGPLQVDVPDRSHGRHDGLV